MGSGGGACAHVFVCVYFGPLHSRVHKRTCFLFVSVEHMLLLTLQPFAWWARTQPWRRRRWSWAQPWRGWPQEGCERCSSRFSVSTVNFFFLGGGRGRGRERGRERGRSREVERERLRQRETGRQRQTERQRDRQRDRQTDTQTDTQTERQTETQTHTDTHRHIHACSCMLLRVGPQHLGAVPSFPRRRFDVDACAGCRSSCRVLPRQRQ